MDQKRAIDYLKAFAIILVVFYHAISFLELSYSSLTYICIDLALRHIHVPLFILIAGYLCHKQDIRFFYKKKVMRILIPFLFMTTLKLILNNVFSTAFIQGESFWHQLFEAFICGKLYWFCYCLLIMFAVAPLLWNRKLLKWILLVVTVAINLILVFRDLYLTDVLQIHAVLYYFPFFLLGMLLAEHLLPGKKTNIRIICLIVAIAVGAVTGYLRFHEDVNDIYLIDFLFGLSVMYVLFMLAELIPEQTAAGKCFSVIGRYSLQIMLLDPFVRLVIWLLFGQILIRTAWMAVIITVVNIAVNCLICMIVEKIPVLSTLMGLKQLKRN